MIRTLCKYIQIRIIIIVSLLFIGYQRTSASGHFIDFGSAPRLIEVSAHAMGGISTISQNYDDVYPQIQNLNINAGNSFGIGVKAVLGIKNYLGFGTALNATLNYYNTDLAIIGNNNSSLNTVFVSNRNMTFNIPIFMSLRFNVSHSVRWDVDLGMYYSFGFAGRQRQQIYRAGINSMDELVPEMETVTTDYYHSPRTIFNVFNRGDIGLHVGTSLDFGPHLTIGLQSQYGLKNAARNNSLTDASVHNFSLLALVGYRF